MRLQLHFFLLIATLLLACDPPPAEVEGGTETGTVGGGFSSSAGGDSTGLETDSPDCDKETLSLLCCCHDGVSVGATCHEAQWICPTPFNLHFDPTCADPLGPCSSPVEGGGSDTGDDPEVVPGWFHPCATPLLVQMYEMKVASHVAACSSCHNATVPTEVLKYPGSLWYNPGNGADTVSRILQLELVDTQHPESSEFLLKPLPPEQGGVPHEGGHFFDKNIKSWGGIHEFVMTAVHCLKQIP